MFTITKRTKQEIVQEIAENIDRLITVDFSFRTVIGRIYRDARARFTLPLTLVAAQALQRALKPHGVLFIATGWPDRPHISPEIGETDGPPGAVLLGMALHKAYNVVPLFAIETQLIPALQAACTAAGFRVLSPEQAIAAAESRAPLHGAAVIDFPTALDQAEQMAESLLDRFHPQAIITVEKGGMNEQGIIHTSRGDDTTGPMAKVDILVRKARTRGIITLGIGDGGNEIGMGTIREALRTWLPWGTKCRCPCGQGIVPSTPTDVLVASTVSNWGAYGIAALLALLTEREDVFHSPEVEERVLRACAHAGLIDGGSGYVSGGADALPPAVHRAVVTLLGELVHKGIAALKQLQT